MSLAGTTGTSALASKTADIVIAGGGAAGAACALAAARGGARVLLIERSAQLGGTVRQALLHTLGGLFDDSGEALHGGLAAELTARLLAASPHTRKRRIGKTWVLNVDPEIYAQVMEQWIAAEAGLEICLQSEIAKVALTRGAVQEVVVRTATGPCALRTGALVDASGSADVVRRIDPACVHEGAALGGFIVQMDGVAADALRFPASVGLAREIRQAAANGWLPPQCASVWLDAGVRDDEAYAKFSVAAGTFDAPAMQRTAASLHDFLRRLPGFAASRISRYGSLGVRDGGRIVGEYCLSEHDIKRGSHFPDPACSACWPIEHWDPLSGLTLEYLPSGHRYQIPLRSLKVRGFSNLWAAGKCLSAEPRAQASARVVGTCWAMGEAVAGQLLGLASRNENAPAARAVAGACEHG